MKNTKEAIDLTKTKILEMTSALKDNTTEVREFLSKYIMPIIALILGILLLVFYFTKIHNRDYKLR